MIAVDEWAVLHLTTSNERYLIGICLAPRQPLVAGPVESFDPVNRTFQITDGQSYQVLHLGQVSVAARRAWRHWCSERGNPAFFEVTEEYEAAIRLHAEEPPSNSRL